MQQIGRVGNIFQLSKSWTAHQLASNKLILQMRRY